MRSLSTSVSSCINHTDHHSSSSRTWTNGPLSPPTRLPSLQQDYHNPRSFNTPLDLPKKKNNHQNNNSAHKGWFDGPAVSSYWCSSHTSCIRSTRISPTPTIHRHHLTEKFNGKTQRKNPTEKPNGKIHRKKSYHGRFGESRFEARGSPARYEYRSAPSTLIKR